MTDKISFPRPLLPSAGVNLTRNEGMRKGESFQEILAQQSLKFSRHAQERISKRKIPLDGGQLQRINAAVEKAAAKGANNSLVLVDNLAFIVSIKNRTVVTAIDENSVRGNVFTKIDSAVIT